MPLLSWIPNFWPSCIVSPRVCNLFTSFCTKSMGVGPHKGIGSARCNWPSGVMPPRLRKIFTPFYIKRKSEDNTKPH